MATCLTDSEILRLHSHAIAPDERAAAEAHLNECSQCREAVARQNGDAALFAEIRQAVRVGELAEANDARGKSGADAGAAATASFDAIDGYEVLAELHRGGQGIVYKATQRATKRTVALKVLLQGSFASPRQRLRFEREIDLAASLRHPNIVTVFDSGTSGGRQFCAMEFIEGRPLGKAEGGERRAEGQRGAEGREEIRETLRLFQKICAAVSYAHQRGVIHRDLKPGNIIVDDVGEPHVLDFGLARLADDSSDTIGRERHLTKTGEFLGTLAYASPEQAAGDTSRIDVRTDVYSLGMILFEMLTGAFPYPVGGSISDVLRHISETEPRRPSGLRHAIDDEVETIVLKALAKEPERRYQSAEQLGRDVLHYLNGQPIDAKRDSTWYVLRKSLRRYRVAVSLAAAFVAVIAVSLVVSLAFWRQAVRDRNAAQTAEHGAERARDAESDAREAAEQQAYVANVAAADAAIGNHDVVEARQRLDRAPARLRNWEWRHLDSRVDESLRTFGEHKSYVYAVAFSRDGRRIVSADWDGTVIVSNAATGERIAARKGPSHSRGAAFSPVGDLVAAAFDDGTVRLWDPTPDKVVATLRGPTDIVTGVAFSPDGSRVAASFGVHPDPEGRDSVVVWNVATRTIELTLSHDAFVHAVTFSPDGKQIASASENRVILWDATNGERTATLSGHVGPVNSVAFAPDGSRLASAGNDKVARVWDAASGSELARLEGHTGPVHAVAFSPDGRRLVTGSRDKTVRVWDAANGTTLAILHGHTWTVTAVAMSGDGARIATGSWDTTVKLWDAAVGNDAAAFRGHTSTVAGIAFNRAGSIFATASWDETIRLWDTTSGRCIDTLRGHEAAVSGVAFSGDGRLVASASWDQTVRVWEVEKSQSDGEDSPPSPRPSPKGSGGEEPRRERVFRGHNDRVHAVAFHPNGRWLLSGSRDNTIRVWDLARGDEVAVIGGHTDHIHCVTFSPDGRWFASSGHSTVKLWDSETQRQVASFPRTIVQEDFSLAFDPRSNLLAAGSDFRTLSVWNLPTRERLVELRGHTDEILSAAFSPDGSRLVSASQDGSVKLWDTATWTELVSLAGHSGRVTTVAFSPDGSRIVGGLETGRIKLWIAPPRRDE